MAKQARLVVTIYRSGFFGAGTTLAIGQIIH
jgi:hypothetical protein